MKLEPGTFVKHLKPEFTKTIGQGDPPTGLSITINEDKYFIPFNTILKISNKCDKKNNIADMSKKPYPLIRKEFVLEHKNCFEIININKKEREAENV